MCRCCQHRCRLTDYSLCFSCPAQAADIDQFDQLMFATLVPLGIVAVSSSVHAAAPSLLAMRWNGVARSLLSCCSRCRSIQLPLSAPPVPASTPPTATAIRQLRDRTVQAVVTVMFLVYPLVSTEIVKSFR
jgi:hypothetical protein